MGFFQSSFTMACLKEEGEMPVLASGEILIKVECGAEQPKGPCGKVEDLGSVIFSSSTEVMGSKRFRDIDGLMENLRCEILVINK